MWVDRDGTVYLYPPWERPNDGPIEEPIEGPISPTSQRPPSLQETIQNMRESEARVQRYKAETDYLKAKTASERRNQPPRWL